MTALFDGIESWAPHRRVVDGREYVVVDREVFRAFLQLAQAADVLVNDRDDRYGWHKLEQGMTSFRDAKGMVAA